MASPSWKSMARTVLLSKRVLKSPFGSFSWAPFWKRRPHGVLEGLAVKVHSDVNHVQGLLPVGCMIAGEISLDP